MGPSEGHVKSRYGLVLPVCMTIVMLSLQVIVDPPGDDRDLLGFALWLVVVILTTMVAVLNLGLAAAWFRQAAWLDGSSLTVRSLRGTRRVDLSVAPVQLPGAPAPPAFPVLTTHTDTGAKVRLALAPAGVGPLPSPTCTHSPPRSGRAHTTTTSRRTCTPWLPTHEPAPWPRPGNGSNATS